eukprot:430875_1
MLNLVVLSLGIVASKADLSCNGVSFEIDTVDSRIYTSIPAGVCMSTVSESHKSSSQLICKGGKIYYVHYASSSDCTGDFTEHEYCSVSPWSNCTSVCDQEPCEYIKEVVYTGVTSCDPIVVSSSSNVNYHITGQCLSISHHPTINSTSMLCDSSSGTAQSLMYTSDDCTGPSTLSTNLIATCKVDNYNAYAFNYSCGTANGVQTTHTPETTIEEGNNNNNNNTIEEVKGNIDDFGTSINPS